jgi:hypothetical protein
MASTRSYRTSSYGGGSSTTAKTQTKYIKPRSKLSFLGRMYNKVRWLCYFLPLFGFIMIWFAMYMALTYPKDDLIVAQTLIAAAGVMTYLAIYYNKRI